MTNNDEVFGTSFCNGPHRLSDGKPIGHECDILPPAALKAEMAGDYATANEILSKRVRRLHKGVKS